MGIFSWILLGLIAGALAKAINTGPNTGGWIITVIIGIIGAIVGGWIGSFFGLGTVNEFSIKTLIVSTGGAVLILWLYSVLKKR